MNFQMSLCCKLPISPIEKRVCKKNQEYKFRTPNEGKQIVTINQPKDIFTKYPK